MSLDIGAPCNGSRHAHEPAPQSLEAGVDGSRSRDSRLPRRSPAYAFDDMTRDDAWRFLVMGRQLERMAFLSSAATHVLGLPDEDCDAVLGALLEIGNISMTYRARYQRHPELLPVLDLLGARRAESSLGLFSAGGALQHLKQVWARLGFRPVNDRPRCCRRSEDSMSPNWKICACAKANLSPRFWRLVNAAPTDSPTSSPIAFSSTPANAHRRTWQHE